MRAPSLPVLLALGALTFLAIGGIIALPNVVSHHRPGNEGLARGALREFARAQAEFRDHRLAPRGERRYANLRELVRRGLLPPRLARALEGTPIACGYAFKVVTSETDPGEAWFATATPVIAGTTGDRTFATNQVGEIFFAIATPGSATITLDRESCALPRPGMIGRK